MTVAVSRRLAYIDTWRCIAVSLVILGHLRFNDSVSSLVSGLGLDAIFDYGYVGVLIFFFISGYVVSTTCLLEVATDRTFSAPAFYVRRIFRIIPPLSIYLLTCLVLGSRGLLDFSATNFVGAATYLCNTTLVYCGWYGGHTWSLAFEEQFYLLFPFVFALRELHRKPSLPRLLPCVAIALLPLVFSVEWIGATGYVATYALFTLGYLFARHQSSIESVLARYSPLLLVVCGCLVFLPMTGFEDPDFETRYRLVYVATIPLLVVSTGMAGSFVKRVFENRVLAYIGRISYSIYLWQELILGRDRSGLPAVAQIGLLLLMLVMCAVLFEVFEKRMIRMGRTLSDRVQHLGA